MAIASISKNARFAAAALAALAAGCLSSTAPEIAGWNVEYSSGGAKKKAQAEKPKYGVVRLALVELNAPYSERGLAVLRPDGSTVFDPYNEYAAEPAMLVRNVAFAALADCGKFEAAVGASSAADCDVEAEVAVTRLALDCREEGKRRAVAAAAVTILRNHKIVAYGRGEGVADAAEPDFAAALSAAASAAFREAAEGL